MLIDRLYWKDHIVEKIIGCHGVMPEEVEEVIYDGNPEVRRSQQNRFLIYGQSMSGRYLFVVVEEESKGDFVPVTARDMSNSEKRAYKKRRKQKHSE